MNIGINMLIVCGLMAAARAALVRKIVIREGYVGLLFRNGRHSRTLTPGRYFRYRPTSHYEIVDMRRRVVTVPGQEVLTGDNVSLKLSASVTYEVSDPVRAENAVQDYAEALYAKVQLALRAVIAEQKVDELLSQRGRIGENAARIVTWQAEEIGLRVSSVEIKDIMFPGDFKRSFAEVAKARQAGQAAIERARAESAVLRSLANTARLLDENPALMNLRLLQTAGASAETTLVLGSPDGLRRMKRPRPRPSSNGDANERET